MEAVLAALGNWAKRRLAGWLARHWPKIVGAAAMVAVVVVVFIAMAATLLSGNAQVAQAATACTGLGYQVDSSLYQPGPIGQAPTIPTGGQVDGFGPDDGEKITNAQTIVAVGQAAGVSRQGLIVAIATALQESGLSNLDYGDRDSLGLFQQRPSQGWGTPEQVRDPAYAAASFFGGPTSPHFNPATGKASPAGLLDNTGWETMPVAVAAQSVQRSGFPSAYAKHEARATVIVDALATKGLPAPTTPTTPGAGNTTGDGTVQFTAADFRLAGIDIDTFCSANFELVATSPTSGAPNTGQTIPAGTWAAPLQARITSVFGNRMHPTLHIVRLHAGTDFHAAMGTPIAAPSVGIVKDITFTSGGGLTVTITHADGVETRHLHLSQALVKPGDTVEGGQIIARSGNTGIGTGPHYHFEVHVNGQAVDPETFMLAHGVNLRAWT